MHPGSRDTRGRTLGTVETHEQRGTGSRLWTWTLPAALLAAVGLLATSWARGLPTVCPAIIPAPASCAPQVREVTGLTGSIVLVLLVTVVLVVGATVPPSIRRPPLALAFLALGAAATAVPLVTLGASGFVLDGRAGPVFAASAFAVVLTVVRLLPRPRTLLARGAGLVLAAVLGVLVLVSLGARALAVLPALGS